MTNNNQAYRTAARLVDLGFEIAAIVDTRTQVDAEVLKHAKAVEHLVGSSIIGVKGRKRVSGVQVQAIGGVSIRTIACDVVLMSGGWDPRVHIASQTGARPVFNPELATFVPGQPVQAERTVGAGAGIFDLHACLSEGVSQASAFT